LEEMVMSEIALLSFGCAVSFIVVAAVYIFATEDFKGAERAPAQKSRVPETDRQHISKAA